MGRRDKTFDFDPWSNIEETFESLKWLAGLGCFDKSAEDWEMLGINTSATSWHYVASMLGTTLDLTFFTPFSLQSRSPMSVMINFLQSLSLKEADNCTCWSALFGVTRELEKFQSFRHTFLHIPISVAPSFTRSLQLVRFLTFEALEMTHTCCAVSCLVHEQMNPSCRQEGMKCKDYIALKYCDPKQRKTIRQDQQDLADQL
ncbi:hypothetical protein QBC38DRAFT_459788 [Podospora fimiseda]|uniref:Uncharacterized protein n=1 Tax=Podospora fimiseda TaxID=252190 RepID=A0AAN7BGD9_9PEZI|nr:hypothetical protein QBC38DRAFT_459788 [Podospora fimiseda]